MQFITALRTLRTCVVSRPAPTALLSSTRAQSAIITSTGDDVSCVGWDGGPLRCGGDKGETGWRWREEKEGLETEDNRKYYEKHKPSPLSEVEFVDTRKPIARATDRKGENKEFVLLKETVDDALRRAEEMWWAAKVRGDLDSPQSRALDRMLRERQG